MATAIEVDDRQGEGQGNNSKAKGKKEGGENMMHFKKTKAAFKLILVAIMISGILGWPGSNVDLQKGPDLRFIDIAAAAEAEAGSISGKHIRLEIYESGLVRVLNDKGEAIIADDPEKVEPLNAPLNTYPQALWHITNPICVYVGGNRY